jgi:hypothetical protein
MDFNDMLEHIKNEADISIATTVNAKDAPEFGILKQMLKAVLSLY